MARKDCFNSAVETELAINLGVGIFNDGLETTISTLFRDAGFEPTQSMKTQLMRIDNKRVSKSVIKETDACRTKRKLIRRKKHQRIAAFQHKEGVQYQTSFFYEKENLAPPPTSHKKRKKSTRCPKCGLDSHVRSNSKLCPYNKKYL